MTLKSLLGLVDDKLADVFHRKAHDPSKARNKVLRGIDRTHEQFHATEPARGKKWFSHKNEVVRFTPPFPVAGKSEHYVPSAQFPDYLGHLRTAVEAGELDDVIAQPVQRSTSRSSLKGTSWTPERRAKFVATRAAKAKSKK